MTYATVDELAAALRIRVTPENTAALQACLDAAAVEINHYVDRRPDSSVEPPVIPDPDPELLPLYNRVNVLRGVEWFKANDAAFGVIGFDDTGALQAPRDAFARHARALIPAKELFGVA